METVQQNLQKCISKGSLNSFERLSNILGGGNNNDSDSDMEGRLETGKTSTPLIGKLPDRIPTAKKSIIEKSKIRGQKKGRKVKFRTSTKKKSKDKAV